MVITGELKIWQIKLKPTAATEKPVPAGLYVQQKLWLTDGKSGIGKILY